MFLFINKNNNSINQEEVIFSLLKAIVNKYKTSESGYDYIVLTTRRCFCILCAFMKDMRCSSKYYLWALKNKRVLEEIQDRFISSQKINIVGDIFKDKNVLLVDDIMIHGQTVYSIYQQIEGFCAKNIDTLVLVRNIEFPDYYHFKTKKAYDSVYKKVDCNWREISNWLVSYMHDSDQMYVSYVYGFYLDKQSLTIALNKNKTEKIKCDLRSFIQHDTYKTSKQPEYYVIKNFESYKFLNYAYLRVYPNNKNDNIVTVIPYAELCDMRVSSIHRIWNRIWKDGKVPKELSSIISPTEQYKVLTVVVSMYIYKWLFSVTESNTTSFNEIQFNETKEIDKSFVDGLINVLKNNLEENVMDIFSSEYETESLEILDDDNGKKLISKWEKSLESVKNSNFALTKIEQFFLAVSDREEVDFKGYISKATNADGVLCESEHSNCAYKFRTNQICSRFKKDLKSDVCAFLLYLLDNGVSSHVVVEKSGYVMTAIKAGEQSYHLFSDLTGSAFRPVYFFLKEISGFDETDRKLKVEQLVDRLLHLPITSAERLDSIIYILHHPPLNLSANYYGIVNRHLSRYTQQDKVEEARFMEMVEDVLKS